MNPTTPPVPPSQGAVPPPRTKQRRWLLWGCASLLGLVVIIAATVGITVWYIQRPIKPVALSATEKAVVEKKLDRLGETSRSASPGPKTREQQTPLEDTRLYVPGSKDLRLTERELNGLLNANTDLGNTLRFELTRDAINAYVTTPIPQDVPVLGGRMFRARGRFRLSLRTGAEPYAILEDVTVFGVSLPKAWLGGIKGENLLADAIGKDHGNKVLRAVKSLRIEPGVLILELVD